MEKNLGNDARKILTTNDRGGFTIPTDRLYPYQWNWDSAFAALGFATFDQERAWRELDLLLEGQWEDGMVPSILFRSDNPDYFPGPNRWQAGNSKMPTTGISQPPVLASVMWKLVQIGDSYDQARAQKLFPKVLKWHRWFHTSRTPDDCPIVATVHPWETGRDNCPDWSIGLNHFEPADDLEPFVRKDTQHIDASMRPTDREYDQYLTIVQHGRNLDWDQKRFTETSPFLMADPGIFFILLRADRDLLNLSKSLGFDDNSDEIRSWIESAEAGSDYLWNDKIEAFCARDVRTGEFSNGFSNASALLHYANIGTDHQRSSTLKHLGRIQSKTGKLVPSWDPEHPSFDSKRYWCGPIWPQMNYMISEGLFEAGHADLAGTVRNDLNNMIAQSGFWECFDPTNGDGCVGTNFSWTAAVWLAFAETKYKARAA